MSRSSASLAVVSCITVALGLSGTGLVHAQATGYRPTAAPPPMTEYPATPPPPSAAPAATAPPVTTYATLPAPPVASPAPTGTAAPIQPPAAAPSYPPVWTYPPTPWMQHPPPNVTVEYSTRTKYVGIAFTVVGVGLGLGSLLAFVASENESGSCRSATLENGTGECDFAGVGGKLASIGLAVAGGVTLLVGIPLIIVGASEVQVPATDPRAIEKLREESASAAPELHLGAGSARMTWRF